MGQVLRYDNPDAPRFGCKRYRIMAVRRLNIDKGTVFVADDGRERVARAVDDKGFQRGITAKPQHG